MWDIDKVWGNHDSSEPEKKVNSIWLLSDRIKWSIVSILVPGQFLLETKLWKWYDENPHHKYSEWDILILDWNVHWYGVNPVAIVEWYSFNDDKWKLGRYMITMYRNDGIDQDEQRSVNHNECYSKWDIENQFKKVGVTTPEEALAYYK